MDRRRIARFVIPAAALAVAAALAPSWPRGQTVHYVLGDAAPLVREVDARWADGRGSEGDWVREVSFRYAPGTAPRVITHTPRLPDGDYTVEVEVLEGTARSVVRRRTTLRGGVTSIDLDAVTR